MRQAAHLSRWAEARGLGVRELATQERIDELVECQRATVRGRPTWSRPGLVCLLDVLRRSGVSPGRGRRGRGGPSPRTCCLGRSSGICSVSGAWWPAPCAAMSITRDGSSVACRRVSLTGVTAADVTASVLRKSEKGSVSAAQNFVAGLRAFLRFCFLEGLLAADLSEATLSVTGRRRSSLPRGVTRAAARSLLAGCDRRTGIGRRDYAMILLLLRLGLRAGETSRLRLDDLDWRAGELVVGGKGAREDRLPLPADVGEAIAAYLRRGRPRSDRREVFMGARAPFAPIAAGTVRSTVRRACRRAGVAEIGAHRLRHTAACQMIAARVPLVQIAGVLQHESLQSTAIYARLDLDQLRRVAAPWPAGGSR